MRVECRCLLLLFGCGLASMLHAALRLLGVLLDVLATASVTNGYWLLRAL